MFHQFKNSILAVLAIVCLLVASQNNAFAVVQGEELLQRFVEHMDSQNFDSPSIEKAQTIVVENRSDPSTAITEALVILHPKYGVALERADADDQSTAIAALKPLTESSDQFLAADASFYLARTLMNGEDYESSLPLLNDLTGRLAKQSAHKGEAQYYTGVAQAGMLDNKTAIQSFMAFLQFNPDATERLRVNAWRQIQELQGIEPGKLVDIRQRMEFSRRRLGLTETNEDTQKQQDKIVAMLGKLIKEEEKKECSNSKGGT
jgi:tetratricopeptide (TPR) repeat protein